MAFKGVVAWILGGGNGGETPTVEKDYQQLDNKPSVNGVTLVGNKTSADLGIVTGQVDELPEASVDLEGTIFQYVGDDTEFLTSGYYYKCVSDGEVEPTYSWEQIDVQPGGEPVLEDALTTGITVGGIDAGTTYAADTPIETVLNDLLNPTLYPAFTNPSLSLSGSGSHLLETGATLAVTLTATFNRGSITPAYGTSGYRSGAATGYSLNGGTEQSENTWSETVSGSNRSFQATVNYAAGEQPKDSKGGNYDSPLPAGSKSSGTVTYDFVDAMWANTANIATVAKLSLVAKSTKQRDMVFPAQTVANPEVFDIPASWTVTAVQVKNDLSGQYEDASSQFTVTDTTHNDAAGNSVNYKRYTFNMGMATGSRTVRVKWS